MAVFTSSTLTRPGTSAEIGPAVLEGDYVINRVAANGPPFAVYGGAGYLHRQLTKDFALNGRFEYLKDKGGLFSFTTQDLKEVTGTAVYQIGEGFQTKLEYRRDFTNRPFFLTEQSGRDAPLANHSDTWLCLVVWGQNRCLVANLSDNRIVPAVMDRKPTPEQLLQQLESEEEHQTHGRLKVFFGYASGVGKSFRMLDEGRRRYERGQDVVLGAMQPRMTCDVQQTINTLEVIPLLCVDGVPVMDLNAILKRRPKVCLVDGLAYNNPPGMAHASRWQEVAVLLDHGISVITSVNLQHIEEMSAQVEGITGKHVTQTVPLSFLQTADEIVVVDIPPESCMSVSEDGRSSAPHRLTQMQLSELREVPCCSQPMSWISSWSATWNVTGLNNPGARRNASWFASRRGRIQSE